MWQAVLQSQDCGVNLFARINRSGWRRGATNSHLPRRRYCGPARPAEKPFPSRLFAYRLRLTVAPLLHLLNGGTRARGLTQSRKESHCITQNSPLNRCNVKTKELSTTISRLWTTQGVPC